MELAGTAYQADGSCRSFDMQEANWWSPRRAPIKTKVLGDDGGVRSSRIYLARPVRAALNGDGALRGQIDVPLDAVRCHEPSLPGRTGSSRTPKLSSQLSPGG